MITHILLIADITEAEAETVTAYFTENEENVVLFDDSRPSVLVRPRARSEEVPGWYEVKNGDRRPADSETVEALHYLWVEAMNRVSV